MIDTSLLSRSIPGWGSDMAPERRPGIPRESAPPNGTGAHWAEPEHMEPLVKIHLTIERPALTPVFGTTCPPKGLSGLLRDAAYRLGEGRLSRWMILMLADRIDVVECAISDLFKGRPDNPITEMGLDSELKNFNWVTHLKRNPKLTATGAVAIIALGLAALQKNKEAA